MNFWLLCALLTLLVALLCFYPLLRNKKPEQAQIAREQLNKAFYFDRLKEIELDTEQGLSENAQQLKTELQQSLLQDIPARQETEAIAQENVGKIWFVTGFLALGIIAGAVYFRVGAWQGQQMLEHATDNLPYFYERLKEEDTKPLTDQEMQQFATALRVKLQRQPQDAQSWFWLGQLGMSLGNGNLAFAAYGKAYRLAPENTEYVLAYARILMLSDDPNEKQLGVNLLKTVIRQDHTNLQALSLLAFYYFEQDDYQMAAATWSMMLKLIPADDPRRTVLEKSVQSAHKMLEK